MKNEKRQQAQNLYFQTNLTKTQIAEQLGVNRRTVMLWCQEGNWEQLRKSARHMPSLVAEKCYYLIDRFASKLLQDSTAISNLSYKDANVINMLATSIKKLKNRNSANESMEMFSFFLESVKKQDPDMAAQMLPFIEKYIETRKDVSSYDFLLEEFTDDGWLPHPAKEMEEEWKDEADNKAFEKEYYAAGQDYEKALENWQKPTTSGTEGDNRSEAA